MVLTLKLPIGPVHIGFSSVGAAHIATSRTDDKDLECGGKRSATPLLDATDRTESGVAAALFCSAGWQPAVSADWQSAERRILRTRAD